MSRQAFFWPRALNEMLFTGGLNELFLHGRQSSFSLERDSAEYGHESPVLGSRIHSGLRTIGSRPMSIGGASIFAKVISTSGESCVAGLPTTLFFDITLSVI